MCTSLSGLPPRPPSARRPLGAGGEPRTRPPRPAVALPALGRVPPAPRRSVHADDGSPPSRASPPRRAQPPHSPCGRRRHPFGHRPPPPRSLSPSPCFPPDPPSPASPLPAPKLAGSDPPPIRTTPGGNPRRGTGRLLLRSSRRPPKRRVRWRQSRTEWRTAPAGSPPGTAPTLRTNSRAKRRFAFDEQTHRLLPQGAPGRPSQARSARVAHPPSGHRVHSGTTAAAAKLAHSEPSFSRRVTVTPREDRGQQLPTVLLKLTVILNKTRYHSDPLFSAPLGHDGQAGETAVTECRRLTMIHLHTRRGSRYKPAGRAAPPTRPPTRTDGQTPATGHRAAFFRRFDGVWCMMSAMNQNPVSTSCQPVPRRPDGRLAPGANLNPHGRPTGSVGGRSRALLILDEISSKEDNAALLAQAMDAAMKKNPLAFFLKYMAPLLPKEALLRVESNASNSCGPWVSMVEVMRYREIERRAQEAGLELPPPIPRVQRHRPGVDPQLTD